MKHAASPKTSLFDPVATIIRKQICMILEGEMVFRYGRAQKYEVPLCESFAWRLWPIKRTCTPVLVSCSLILCIPAEERRAHFNGVTLHSDMTGNMT